MGSTTISTSEKRDSSFKIPVPKSPDTEDPEQLGFQKQPMVDWYSPSQLAQTGVRAIISAMFGNYADKREIQAALAVNRNLDEPFDFSDRDSIWIDYVSDLGSGWDSTYSVAYLLGRKTLSMEDSSGTHHNLPRGNILIMGGDEVYPTATWKEYENRLAAPYRCSLPYVHQDDDPPTLFSIPGNHDWYDGLSSFIKLFCQKRWIGGWETKQTRSYFAAKLPHNWWLWGIDIQLSADIDKPQIDYFDRMCEKVEDGDSIILCTAEPVWVYQQYQPDDKPFKNLNFFQNRYDGNAERRIHFKLVLTGDMHHYTSFRKADEAGTDWKITAGGGGAFSHPTHQVPDKLNLGEEIYEKSAAYPDAGTSMKLAWNNLKFPFINRRFGMLFAALYLLFAWMTGGSGAGMLFSDGSFLHVLAASSLGDINEIAYLYGTLLLASPGLSIFLLILVAGIMAFADTNRKKALTSWIAGGLHGLFQAFLLLFATWFTARLVLDVWSFGLLTVPGIGLFALIMSVAGWLLSGYAMGLYLMVTTLLLKTHETEAFSSFRGENYKNFIRIQVNREGLQVYPVKIPKAGKRWNYKAGAEGEAPWYEPGENLGYGLIEDPIKIKRT